MLSKKPKLMMSGHTDEIYTPKYALNPLLPYLKKEWLIWECAIGTRKLAEYLKEEGFKVIGDNSNFLEQDIELADCIITNPPYSLKDKFLEHAFKIGKPFAFLLPISALGAEKRTLMYKKYGIQVIIPTRRINYITPKNGKSAWFHSIWICYKMNLPNELNFVELKK